jgi:hypothetical protein
MSKPIDNPIKVRQTNKVLGKATYEDDPPALSGKGFERIESGPNRGFYRRIPPDIYQGKQTVYSKAFFKTPIKYLYRDYIPQYKGFYYIPRNDELSIRKLVYGLRKYDIPSTGNMEEFYKRFENISVPRNFCPIIEPCIYNWCRCHDKEPTTLMMQQKRVNPGFWNIVYLFIATLMLVLLVILAVFW